MIRGFGNQGTEDVFDGLDTKQRRLSQLDYARSLEDLRLPRSNRLHRLEGDRKGQHSISINREYRICFFWTEAGPERVEVVDYH